MDIAVRKIKGIFAWTGGAIFFTAILFHLIFSKIYYYLKELLNVKGLYNFREDDFRKAKDITNYEKLMIPLGELPTSLHEKRTYTFPNDLNLQSLLLEFSIIPKDPDLYLEIDFSIMWSEQPGQKEFVYLFSKPLKSNTELNFITSDLWLQTSGSDTLTIACTGIKSVNKDEEFNGVINIIGRI